MRRFVDVLRAEGLSLSLDGDGDVVRVRPAEFDRELARYLAANHLAVVAELREESASRPLESILSRIADPALAAIVRDAARASLNADRIFAIRDLNNRPRRGTPTLVERTDERADDRAEHNGDKA